MDDPFYNRIHARPRMDGDRHTEVQTRIMNRHIHVYADRHHASLLFGELFDVLDMLHAVHHEGNRTAFANQIHDGPNCVRAATADSQATNHRSPVLPEIRLPAPYNT